jgi:release factor glutamine methyltransferase
MTTIAAALAAARAKLPASEARLLLGHVMRQGPAWLIAHDDELLDEDALLAFAALVARRAGGEPVAYLVGYREFFGRRFAVSPAVLIPRPETELLIELALARVGAGALCVPGNPLARREAESRVCRDRGQLTPGILDLGTGSGCIAITLALELPLSRVTAADSSGAALQVAASNARSLGASLRLLQGDWYSGLGGERFDLIVSNPPYIAAGDPHLASGDLRHEPGQAPGQWRGRARRPADHHCRRVAASDAGRRADDRTRLQPGRRGALADGRCRVLGHQGACGSCRCLARYRRRFAIDRRSACG